MTFYEEDMLSLRLKSLKMVWLYTVDYSTVPEELCIV